MSFVVSMLLFFFPWWNICLVWKREMDEKKERNTRNSKSLHLFGFSKPSLKNGKKREQNKLNLIPFSILSNFFCCTTLLKSICVILFSLNFLSLYFVHTWTREVFLFKTNQTGVCNLLQEVCLGWHLNLWMCSCCKLSENSSSYAICYFRFKGRFFIWFKPYVLICLIFPASLAWWTHK